MSGGACAIIIGDGEQLKAAAQQTVNLWTLEMQRQCSWTREQREAYHARVRRALAIMQEANEKLAEQMGPPHDQIGR